ncbi:MAG: CAP domain-containing protein [Sulfobacillus benefaciens]|uniref:CAP domain-containing protein n=1 Tax=Sulfobacillus benefaciens TaxID=453960 RepID=A0A2T2XCV5_9FIRM|nr:MAG: CAP domain-containing protein [Sulfobacillus benefaciens]
MTPRTTKTLRRLIIAGAAPVLALGSLFSGPNPNGLTAPISGYWPIHLVPSLFGPYSTPENNGYETANQISPIIPLSYVAWREPHLLGVQFIGDAPRNLASDQFSLTIKGPRGYVTGLKAQYFSNGFVGWKVPSLPAGKYRVTFMAPGFQQPQSSWTVTIAKSPRAISPVPETSADQASLASLNAYRAMLDEAPVAWNQSLADAAMAHARYLAKNGYNAPSFHMEEQGRPGFSGRTPWARDLVYGWPSILDGEVGIEWTQSLPPVAVIQDLVDTVYHRLSLLSANLFFSGEGSTTGKTGAVVMDLGYGYSNKLPLAITYPRPGQTGLPTAWVDLESPDPVPNGYGNRYGYPITVDFPTVETLKDVRVGLFEGTERVAIYKDMPGVNSMAENQLGMVPRYPLNPNTVYSVEVFATATFNSGITEPVNLHWRFSTGGDTESVAVAPLSPHHILVSVVRAGNGEPDVHTLVRIYRVFSPTRQQMVGTGRTGLSGTWNFERKKGMRALYNVVTQSGNSDEFWW